MGRQPQYNGASSRFEFTSSGFETGRLESYLRYPFVEVSVSPTLLGSDGPLRSISSALNSLEERMVLVWWADGAYKIMECEVYETH